MHEHGCSRTYQAKFLEATSMFSLINVELFYPLSCVSPVLSFLRITVDKIIVREFGGHSAVRESIANTSVPIVRPSITVQLGSWKIPVRKIPSVNQRSGPPW